MQHQLKDLVIMAGGITYLPRHHTSGELKLPNTQSILKFVDLVKQSLYNDIVARKRPPDQLETEVDQCAIHWMNGYDTGIVDALCEVINFGVDDVRE